ncbi:MAG: uroporphyrinogen decarboxylase family protein [Oscillospiraceae bacterium]|nr:uroporphyrinogen decarboxylase family protein [Oscillospiraceae bacterium]
MNMDLWVREQIATQDKKAMPLLSYPAVQQLFITVDRLVNSSSEMALGVRLMADRYNMPFATTYMDLSIEAEAFGAACTYHTNEIPTITGQIVSDEEEANALQIPEVGAGRTGKVLRALGKTLTLVNDRPVFANCTGPFSMAGRLMDVNEALILTYEEPELVHTVLEKCTQFLLKYIKAMKDLGANGVIMAEPLAGLMSVNAMQEFSSNYVRRIIDELQDRDFVFVYHNCSNAIEKKADAVISTGARMFHFGENADMWQLLQILPKDVIVMGNISPSAVFMCDSTDKMAQDTQNLLRKCLVHENFMISSGCDIPAHTPLQNIDKFFEVINLGYHKVRLWNQINRAYPHNPAMEKILNPDQA